MQLDGDSKAVMRADRKGTLAALRGSLRSDSVRCLLLLAIGFVVRMPALQGAPIWDDDYLVRENPFAKSPFLIAEAFRHHLFLDSLSYHYRPVQNISLAFDYLIWNTTWYGYHLTNLLLHLGNALLLYFLLCRLLAGMLKRSDGDPTPIASLCAFVVALLWVVHPVHSAAVDYISGRADSLAFFFAAGGWLLYLRARICLTSRTRRAYYVAAVFCGMLALCSREIACVWLALFLLHGLVFERPLQLKKMVAVVACCVAMLGGYAALRNLPEQRPAPPQNSWSASTRAVLMLRALGDYGRLTVWPSTLRMERNVIAPENYRSNKTWRTTAQAEYLSILGLGVLVVLVYGATRRGAGRPMRAFGAVWFAVGYLPISNLVELNATVAEHWLYLPIVGLLLFLVGCALDLPRPRQHLAGALAALAVCGFGARAYMRSSDWVTPRTFYERTIAAGGSSVRVAVNLGIIYSNSGEYRKAESAFRRVLSMVPDYPVARNNLADVLYRQGREEEAKALLNETKAAAAETRKDYPRTWMAALKLAAIRREEHDNAGALEILEQARINYPEIWQIISAESELLRETRGPAAALHLVAGYAHEHWWHYHATFALGQLLAEKGDIEAAAEQLQLASWLDIHDARALTLLARLRLRQNRLDDARAVQQRVVSRQPDEPSHYRLLAEILSAMGRNSDAQSALAEFASLEALAKSQLAAN